MIRNKRQRRGASLQRRPTPFQWKRLFSLNGRLREQVFQIRTLAYVMLIAVATALMSEPLQNWVQRPVGAVKINGDLRFVSQKTVIEVMQPLIADGYWKTDIAQIERELEKLTWVDAVTITRIWPDGLDVAITEQQAIARWGTDELISYRGHVFKPETIKGFESLPRLAGPENTQADVMQRFSVLSDLLRSNALQLVALAVDDQGGWRAELSNDVVMELGGGDLMEKMQRFLLVYRQSLQPRFAQVARIDLRYGAGLAVGWREPSSHDVAPLQATSKKMERQG